MVTRRLQHIKNRVSMIIPTLLTPRARKSRPMTPRIQNNRHTLRRCPHVHIRKVRPIPSMQGQVTLRGAAASRRRCRVEETTVSVLVLPKEHAQLVRGERATGLCLDGRDHHAWVGGPGDEGRAGQGCRSSEHQGRCPRPSRAAAHARRLPLPLLLVLGQHWDGERGAGAAAAVQAGRKRHTRTLCLFCLPLGGSDADPLSL